MYGNQLGVFERAAAAGYAAGRQNIMPLGIMSSNKIVELCLVQIGIGVSLGLIGRQAVEVSQYELLESCP
jgi:hypothetical protein